MILSRAVYFMAALLRHTCTTVYKAANNIGSLKALRC